jgi:formate dehydrogenase accessory protein FdhE
MASRATDSTATARAARARELQASASAAADMLGFYAALAEYQERLIGQSASAYAVSGFAPLPSAMARPSEARSAKADSRTSGTLLQGIDAEWVSQAIRDFVAWWVRLKPDATNAALRDVTGEEWRELFESYRASPEDAAARFGDAEAFALEAVLQPIAERLAARGVRLQPDRGSGAGTGTRCPICGGTPVVAVLREEGHGARRRLVCALCFTEWDYLRLVCVKCGEQRFDVLPVFSADQFPHARVDACDTCRSYMKTIDATKDGRVIPVVDDLATIALDLWAREQGYTRVRANLFRT